MILNNTHYKGNFPLFSSAASNYCNLKAYILLLFYAAIRCIKLMISLPKVQFSQQTRSNVTNTDLFGVIEDHAGRVINRNHHLVLSLTWLDSPQPELVLSEVTGYVLNHAPHARSFASTKTTSVKYACHHFVAHL